MDRHMAASLDQWLTTEPEPDGVECWGASGTPYPEHEFGNDGECHRCGATADDNEEETE